MNYAKKFTDVLSSAGITVNGNKPWDVQIHNEDTFKRIIFGGSIAAGESYMDEWWDVEDLSVFFSKIFESGIENQFTGVYDWVFSISTHLFNLQNKKRSKIVGKEHYDIGNDLYSKMLDSRMVYTCGYWKNARTLNESQEAKLELVCKKIGLKEGDRVIDIGGGWGSFAKFAAERYKAEVVAITISEKQAELGRKLTKGLNVEIRVQDYRDVNEKFDHVVSLGMFEHVGYKNYHIFMKKMHSILKDDGLFLLHTIGGNNSVFSTDPWINKYIFPNGMLPSIAQIGKSIEEYFVMEDWHNFGVDYDKTLMAWYENFNTHWNEINDKYNDKFYRMWKYYLLLSAATFRSRRNQLWQIVLSKDGVKNGYESIR